MYKTKLSIPDTIPSTLSNKVPLINATCSQSETVKHIIFGCQVLAAEHVP